MLQGLFDASLKASNARQANLSRELLEERCSLVSAAPDAYEALQPAEHIKLIAEIKRRSPSRGFLAEIPDAKALGAGYESSGAHAISVLTEESGFGGKLSDLQEVSEAVTIPTLRKDFILDEYQILEAKAAGASMVLLILAQLSKAEFQGLYDFCKSIGLEPFVETHSAEEIAIAADNGARLIGINTRDLATFKTDIGLFENLAAKLPSDCVKIAESSVKQLADVERYRSAGADCVLVGEALVSGDWATLIPEFTSVS